jgi:CrcB protein
MRTAVGIGVAGALGALARYGLDGWIARRTPGAFPLGTFVVNVSGAFLVGVLFIVLTERYTLAPWLRSSILIGLLGGYTTFSTLTLETYRLIEDGAYLLAAANGVGSLAAGLAGVYAGVVVGRAL